jgi:hypothetical protein
MFSGFSVTHGRPAAAAIGVLTLLFLFAGGTAAQGGASNDMGNGGIHRIQGRVYVQDGRRADITGIRIRLLNHASNDLTVIADGSGSFQFRNLVSGSYTVRVEGGGRFEDVTESVIIDDPGSSNLSQTVRLRGAAKMASVQIFLKPKSPVPSGGGQVINAKLASTRPRALRGRAGRH